MSIRDESVRILMQPDDQIAPVLAMMNSACASLCIKMFVFTSPTLVEAIERAHQRGVRVRIMLNQARSSGSRANDDVFQRFAAAGIEVSWASPHFAVTHEKSMVVDERTALIATFNFADKYFSLTRDYGVVVTDAAIVAEILAGFEADWRHGHLQVPDASPLVWSNRNARETMAAFIDGTHRRLQIQHPKYSDTAILDRLMDALRRGVHVQIICGGKHGISPPDMLDTFSSLRVLVRAGAKLRKQHLLRLHAKLLVADNERAMVGSMNIDRSAFDLRRELGIVLSKPDAVATLQGHFEADWEAAGSYEPPDPLALHLHVEEDVAPDEELDHE